MEKDEIIAKLAELGIVTQNCYPKSSFPRDGDIHIGLFRREMNEDFYFFNTYDKKVYQFPKPEDPEKYEKDSFKGNTKYLIPLHECKMIWEDKVYVELPDIPHKEMTVRQFACITLGIPKSGLDWLDQLIKEKQGSVMTLNPEFTHLLKGIT